jgi:uncharacterized repeat protein (TIGR03803 family)
MQCLAKLPVLARLSGASALFGLIIRVTLAALWNSKKEFRPRAQGDPFMQRKKLSSGLRAKLTIFSLTLFVMCAYVSAQETVLLNFSYNNGDEPIAGLIMDAAGNLYGTTFYGGAYGNGTIFELTPHAGVWAETVLYSFTGASSAGFWPNSRLVFDASGNLYGTTFFGGQFQVGTVFELSPAAGGSWTETTIHDFNPKNLDGSYPHAGLIVDASGNLYGTAAGGGHDGDGIVFELSPSAGGDFTEKILRSFSGSSGGDGANPYSSLVFDASGNLYGTTAYGGTSAACNGGCGTVFELIPTKAGNWMEKTLSFRNTDGANPYGGLILDASGNLYGATSQGASGNFGAIFELTPAGNGWTESILHTFSPHLGDGMNPQAPLIFDAAGNLYGTTESGGASGGGTAYELTPTGEGDWTKKILDSFSSAGGAAHSPAPGVTIDSFGNLYGAAISGGDNFSSCYGGCGAVFEIAP